MTRDPGLESWIVDASPLILLGNIGQLVLLEALAPRINVPEAVLEDAGVFELEFADMEGRTYASLALPEHKLMPLHHQPVEDAA